jgi:hypothetical protein
MIGGYVRNLLNNKPLAAIGGALIGYKAMSGSLFAQLLALGSMAQLSAQKKKATCTEVARQAAMTEASRECGTDVDCLKSQSTIDAAKAAAIAAGKECLTNESGVVAIEAAIIMPVALLMFLGAFTIGEMQWAKSTLSFGAQQSAIAQAQGQDPQPSFATNIANTPAKGATVVCSTTGTVATCAASVAFNNVFSGIMGLPPTITLASSASATVPQ